MAKILTVPKISETVTEITINSWHVKEGETKAPNQLLSQFETDKAIFDYESPAAGVLLKIIVPAGETVQVGLPLAIVGQAGEDYSELLKSGKQ
ncbi:MAG: biotin/lipoyl-containing protein [Planctomycetota bacterium]